MHNKMSKKGLDSLSDVLYDGTQEVVYFGVAVYLLHLARLT